MNKFFITVFLVCMVAFTALVVWAIQVSSFSAAADAIFGEPWGIVTLVDLYIGFFIFAFFISLLERTFARSIIWILPLLVLGNGVALLYLAFALYTGRIDVTKQLSMQKKEQL